MLTAALAFFWLLPAPPQSKPADDAGRLDKLFQGTPAEQQRAFELVVAHASATSSVYLFLGASKGLELGHLEDAGFLFYAAQLRSRFDLKVFPPVGTGGDSPGVALAALNQEIGAAVNPALMREPKAFKAVVDRLRAFDLQTPAGYDPGWPHQAPLAAAEAKALAQSMPKERLEAQEGMATLLNIPEYFTAFRALQDYNFSPFEEQRKPQNIAAKEKAEKTIREIEERLKIPALFYRKPGPAPSP